MLRGVGILFRRPLKKDNLFTTSQLEQVGLLHDAEELFLIDFAIAIAICLINHLLELLIRHPLTKLLCDTLQVLEGDLTSLVIIEEAECLQDLVLRVTVQDLVRHHLEKFFILDRSTASM